jgi:hypothetical protein
VHEHARNGLSCLEEHDGQVGLDGEHRSSRSLLLGEHLTTTLVEHRVDTTDGIFGTLNFDY